MSEQEAEKRPPLKVYAFEWGEDGEFFQGQVYDDDVLVYMTDQQRKQVIAMLLDPEEDDPDEFW